MTHSSPNPYAGSQATYQPTPTHGSPCLHTRQHPLCSTAPRGGHRAPRMHSSQAWPTTHTSPRAHLSSQATPTPTPLVGPAAHGARGSLAVFLLPGVLPGPGKGSCALLRPRRGPSCRETRGQPPLPSTHLASGPERSPPPCGSLECGGLRGQRPRRGHSQAVLGKEAGYVQVNLPSSGL